MKIILFGKSAREKIKRGIDRCVDVVKVSMGKSGRNVLIYNGTTTDIINDGVSIAREVEVKDEVENAGITLAKQCASKTNIQAGDGTTTTLVLLQSFLNELVSDTQLAEPRKLRREVRKSVDGVIKRLDKQAKKVTTKEELKNIALTASLDEDIAEVISEIFWKLGKDANILTTESEYNVLESNIVEGIKFDSVNVALYSDKKEEYEDIPIVVFKKRVSAMDIHEKLKVLAPDNTQALIIAPQFEKDALALMVQHKMEGRFLVAAVRPNESEKNLEDDIISYGNRAKRVIVEKGSTTIVGGNGNTEARVKELKEKFDKEESKFQKELLAKRISFLTGGVADIKIGKQTDVERQEYVLKIEDAINSTRNAYQSGYVKGGGVALMDSAPKITTEGDRIVKKVCEAPKKQLNENVGDTFKVEDSVIDSIQVVKASLLNAESVACSILTTESALIEVENNDS